MTTPKIHTINRGGVRYYVHPTTGEKVPGVTSILNMLPKPFLQYWGQKVVAETAVDKLGAIVDLAVKGDRQGAIDYLKRAPGRDTKDAAGKGDEVHSLVDLIFRGKPAGRVHPDYKPYVDGAKAFVDRYQPTFLEVEAVVWNDVDNYAGSFDWLATIVDEGGVSEIVMGDNKTTRSGVHDEVALQLNAYANGRNLVRPDGTTLPMPKVDAAAVLWLRPDAAQLVPVRLDPDFMDVFRALMQVQRWDKDLSSKALGLPIDLLEAA